jgi:RNA polymerase sigma-70 factor (ECF subfamily)
VSSVLTGETAELELSGGEASEATWRAIYDDQFDRVYRLVAWFGVAPGDVEDVTQQAFVIAYRRIGEIDGVRSVSAWLRGIAVKVTSDYHRWWRVRRAKQWLLESSDRRPEPATPERETEVARTQEAVNAVLRRMSPKLRAVLVLCDIEECSVSEAAEALAIPTNTVRSRRRIARETFQELWGQKGGAA